MSYSYKEQNHNAVVAPKHYMCPSGNELDQELIDMFGVEKVMDFYQINAVKYLKRHEQKNGHQDLMKAIECIRKLDDLQYGDLPDGTL